MPDHQWVEIRVDLKKTVSDGNYGGETAQVTLSDWVLVTAEAADREAIAELMLRQARSLVHGELARSPSTKVRAAMGKSTAVALGPVDYDDEGDEAPF